MANTCTCGIPATRLQKVVPHSRLRAPEKREIQAELDREVERPIRWASCEAHRVAVKQRLTQNWQAEVDSHKVAVIMGPIQKGEA